MLGNKTIILTIMSRHIGTETETGCLSKMLELIYDTNN